MSKMKKIVSVMIAAAMSAGLMSGCGGGGSDGRVELKVGNWPTKAAEKETLDKWDGYAKEFEEKYPDIKVVKGETYTYDTKTFNARAAAGQLPTFLETYYTEISVIQKNGYASDITQALKDNNLLNKINPDVLKLLTDESGRICGIPSYAYTQGLVMNKAIFEQAGLVDDNGKPLAPKTYRELAEYSKIIKEKTGISGFVMPTIDNCGGWIFMNIAWSFGVDFEELQDDGTWKAIFDTPEFRNALQYVYDLRWKYDAFPDNKVLDYAGYLKTFGVGQAAMTIADPGSIKTLPSTYGMDKDSIYFAKMPEGEAGRYAQIGGGAKIFFSKNTPEQNDAGVKWLMLQGYTPDITPEVEKNLRETYKKNIEDGAIVFPQELFATWQSEERSEKIKEIAADYANVDMDNYADYFDFTGVILRPEESACCQQLYSILDGVIQEVMTNENADIDALTKTAVEDFQKNHLDKMD